MNLRTSCRILAVVLTAAVLLSGCMLKSLLPQPEDIISMEIPSASVRAPETSSSEAPSRQEISAETSELVVPQTRESEPTAQPIATLESNSETEAPAEPDPVPTFPAPTQPSWVRPEPSGENLTDSFHAQDWKRVNTFLSNFSEVFFDDYNVDGQIYEYDLLIYGYLHLKINDYSKLRYQDMYYTISKNDMDNCLNRFFGMTVQTGEASKTFYEMGQYSDYDIEYRNHTFFFPAADGEAYNQLSVVNRMERTDHNTYYVWFDIYEMEIQTYFESGITADDYSCSSLEAKNDPRLEQCGSGVAELRDYTNGGLVSYQLLWYDVD